MTRLVHWPDLPPLAGYIRLSTLSQRPSALSPTSISLSRLSLAMSHPIPSHPILQHYHDHHRLPKFSKKISNSFTKSSSKSSSSLSTKPLYLTEPYVKSSLTTGNIKNIVLLPSHLQKEHLNEWLAVNGIPVSGGFFSLMVSTFSHGVLHGVWFTSPS